MRGERSVSVEIPAGVSGNNYLTLRGQGAAGPRNGPAGDLLVMLDIKDDDRFERQGDDLIFDLPVSFSQAALGGEFDVPTPYGVEQVRVPSGTQPETVVRLKQSRSPVLGQSGKGDLLIRVHVWTPERSQRRAGADLPRAGQARGRAAPPLTRILVQAQGSARRMTWWAIDVRTAPDRREQVGAWLVAKTGQAVEERDDGTLVTFAPDEAAADALVAELARAEDDPAQHESPAARAGGLVGSLA